MYISEFWFGVGATLFAEIVAVFVAAVVCSCKNNKK